MTDRRTELYEQYAWFGKALEDAHAAGNISGEHVRYFIGESHPILEDEDGEPILDADGELQYDPDAEPVYTVRAQAYSYVGNPPDRTVAGQVDLSLQLLDQTDPSMLIRVVSEDLSRNHDERLARMTP